MYHDDGGANKSVRIIYRPSSIQLVERVKVYLSKGIGLC